MLRGIPAIEPKDVIIGQYGKSLDGSKPSYKEDDTVPKDSRCPTFCAMVAHIKNERWDGVPFILKAGKGEIPSRSTEVHGRCHASLLTVTAALNEMYEKDPKFRNLRRVRGTNLVFQVIGEGA